MDRRKRRYGFSFLNTLSQKIRDLSGFVPMSRELIQNADDEKCEWISFKFTNDALIIKNPSVISENNFDKITEIGSEDKITDPEKTGRFGVGFVSVFQICDKPEINSNNIKLTLNPLSQDADDEDEETGDGTTLILKWASEQSDIRAGLKMQVVGQEDREKYYDELIKSLNQSLLFLRHVKKITVIREGESYSAERVDNDSNIRKILLKSGNTIKSEYRWFVIEERLQDSRVMPDKRNDKIGIAFPLYSDNPHDFAGILYCTLPTRTNTNLPVFINGDFAIKSDRMNIIDDGNSLEVNWNKHLVKNLGILYTKFVLIAREILKDEQYADLLPEEKYYNPSCPILEGIYSEFIEKAKDNEIIKTANGNWVKPAQARLLSSREYSDLYNTLVKLNIPLVNTALLKKWNLLSEKLKVRKFGTEDILSALQSAGINNGITETEMAAKGLDTEKVIPLWKFLESRVHGNETSLIFQKELNLIKNGLPLCLTSGRKWVFFSEVCFFPDDLLEALPLISEHYSTPSKEVITHARTLLENTIKLKDLETVYELLGEKTGGEIEDILLNDLLDLTKLFNSFEKNHKLLENNKTLCEKIGKLNIYPSKIRQSFRSINELFVPGDFNDPIGLDIIFNDNGISENVLATLKTIGLKKLDISSYLKRILPGYFDDYTIYGETDNRIKLLTEIKLNWGKVEDNNEIVNLVKQSRCIYCTDKEFHIPSEVYADCSELKEIFAGYPSPDPDSYDAGHGSWISFFNKTGVSSKPKIPDIVNEIRRISEQEFNEGSGLIEVIFYYLAKQFSYTSEADKEYLKRLRYWEWLPVMDEDIYVSPAELYLKSVAYLVGSRKKILRFTKESLMGGDFRECIGLRSKPPINVIIENLKFLRDENAAPNINIYGELKNNINNLKEGDIYALLNENLLYSYPDSKFTNPNKVFWASQPFGNRRCILSNELRAYQPLIQEVMNVRNEPGIEDYLKVLEEIGDDFSKTGNIEDNDINLLNIIYNFVSNHISYLADKQDENEKDNFIAELKERFKNKKVVLTREKELKQPGHTFFADKKWAITLFEKKIKDLLVDRVPQTYLFLECAGVRLLSNEIEVKSFREPELKQQCKFEKLLSDKARQHEIKRIVETYSSSHDNIHLNEEMLFNLKITECDDLEVEYFIIVDDHEISSDMQNPDSYYDEKLHELFVYYDMSDDSKRLEISRNAAYILQPEAEPSVLSSQINHVLDPDKKAHEISDILTRIGINELKTIEIKQPEPFAGQKVGVSSIIDEPSENKDEKPQTQVEQSAKPSGSPGSQGKLFQGDEKGIKTPATQEELDKLNAQKAKYFKDKAESFTKRNDFELFDKPTLPEKKEILTPEQAEEHRKLVKIFYNREIKKLETRLQRIDKEEITSDIYGEDWAEISLKTRERDGNCCRRCGATDEEVKEIGTRLEVHHIIPRKSLGSNWPSNLITLCKPCHREVEKHPEYL